MSDGESASYCDEHGSSRNRSGTFSGCGPDDSIGNRDVTSSPDAQKMDDNLPASERRCAAAGDGAPESSDTPIGHSRASAEASKDQKQDDREGPLITLEDVVEVIAPDLRQGEMRVAEVKKLKGQFLKDNCYIASLLLKMGRENIKSNRRRVYDLLLKRWDTIFARSLDHLLGRGATETPLEPEGDNWETVSEASDKEWSQSYAGIRVRQQRKKGAISSSNSVPTFYLTIDAELALQLRKRKASARNHLFRKIAAQGNLPENCSLIVHRDYELQTPDERTAKLHRGKPANVLPKPWGWRMKIICRHNKARCLIILVTLPFESSCSGEDVTLKWELVRPSVHHAEAPPRDLRGDVREEVKLEARQHGSAFFVDKKKSECRSGSLPKFLVPKKHVVIKAASEGVASTSAGRFDDILAQLRYDEEQDQNYVRSFSILPLQIVFALESQVELFVRSAERVLFLDATGGVVLPCLDYQTPRDSQRPIFLYSAVFENPSPGNMALPLAEAIMSVHRTRAIASFLGELRDLLIMHGRKNGGSPNLSALPKRVVVDFSWAFIHAVLLTLPEHPTNIHDFLRGAHRLLSHSQNLSGSFCITLCHSHVIHAWTRHSSFQGRKRGERGIVIRGAVFIMMADNLREAINRFRMFAHLCLCSRASCEHVHRAITAFEDMDSADPLLSSSSGDCIDEEDPSDPHHWLQHDEDDERTARTIREGSPFYQDFAAVCRSVKAEIEVEDDDDTNTSSGEDDVNRHRCKEFLHYFLARWLPIFPLWGVCSVDPEAKKKMTNGLVERYIRYVKQSEPDGTMPVAVGRFLGKHREMQQIRCDAAFLDLQEAEKKRRQTRRGVVKSKKKKTPYKEPLGDKWSEFDGENWKGKAFNETKKASGRLSEHPYAMGPADDRAKTQQHPKEQKMVKKDPKSSQESSPPPQSASYPFSATYTREKLLQSLYVPSKPSIPSGKPCAGEQECVSHNQVHVPQSVQSKAASQGYGQSKKESAEMKEEKPVKTSKSGKEAEAAPDENESPEDDQELNWLERLGMVPKVFCEATSRFPAGSTPSEHSSADEDDGVSNVSERQDESLSGAREEGNSEHCTVGAERPARKTDVVVISSDDAGPFVILADSDPERPVYQVITPAQAGVIWAEARSRKLANETQDWVDAHYQLGEEKRTLLVFTSDLRTLHDTNWISGTALEAYVHSLLQQRPHLQSKYAVLSSFYINQLCEMDEKRRKRKKMRDDQELKGLLTKAGFGKSEIIELAKIIGFFHQDENHWVLVVIDVERGEVRMLDPRRALPDATRMGAAKRMCLVWDYTFRHVDGKDLHPKQRDGWSCGVFCSQLAKRIINDEPDLDFPHKKNELIKFKQEMAVSILTQSQPYGTYCNCCGTERANEWVQCDHCNRWICVRPGIPQSCCSGEEVKTDEDFICKKCTLLEVR